MTCDLAEYLLHDVETDSSLSGIIMNSHILSLAYKHNIQLNLTPHLRHLPQGIFGQICTIYIHVYILYTHKVSSNKDTFI